MMEYLKGLTLRLPAELLESLAFDKPKFQGFSYTPTLPTSSVPFKLHSELCQSCLVLLSGVKELGAQVPTLYVVTLLV